MKRPVMKLLGITGMVVLLGLFLYDGNQGAWGSIGSSSSVGPTVVTEPHALKGGVSWPQLSRSKGSSYKSYRSKSSFSKGSTSHKSYSSHTGRHSKNYCTWCARDSHGKIKRSEKAKDVFKKSHPCPSTGKSSSSCPGYVIDHIKPLKRGGADDPSNMQWQTKEDAKRKDKIE